MTLAPRFDSTFLIVGNAVTIVTFFAVIWIGLRRRRQGHGPTVWGWLAIGIHTSIAGLYLPIGPLLWLATHRADDRTARS